MTIIEVFSGFSFWSVALFSIGIIALTTEIFIPNFGMIGITGIISLVFFVIVSASSLVHGLILGGIILFIIFIFILIFLWVGAKGKFPKKMLLADEQDRKEGYIAADYSTFLEAVGIAVSPLRPAGIMKVGDEKLDVVSEIGFIEKGSLLRIKKIEGGRLVVEPVENSRE